MKIFRQTKNVRIACASKNKNVNLDIYISNDLLAITYKPRIILLLFIYFLKIKLLINIFFMHIYSRILTIKIIFLVLKTLELTYSYESDEGTIHIYPHRRFLLLSIAIIMVYIHNLISINPCLFVYDVIWWSYSI